jgi:hypothetical protein
VAAFGKVVNGVGAVLFVVTGIWGLVLSLDIITDVIGFWGMIAAIILAPITFFVVPIYAGLALGIWFPVVLNYGGCLLAILLMAVGSRLDRDSGGLSRSAGSHRTTSGP